LVLTIAVRAAVREVCAWLRRALVSTQAARILAKGASAKRESSTRAYSQVRALRSAQAAMMELPAFVGLQALRTPG